ncbi:hypothetical protein NKG94_31010 [Micromonospora sp. M12]
MTLGPFTGHRHQQQPGHRTGAQQRVRHHLCRTVITVLIATCS